LVLAFPWEAAGGGAKREEGAETGAESGIVIGGVGRGDDVVRGVLLLLGLLVVAISAALGRAGSGVMRVGEV